MALVLLTISNDTCYRHPLTYSEKPDQPVKANRMKDHIHKH